MGEKGRYVRIQYIKRGDKNEIDVRGKTKERDRKRCREEVEKTV